jgi:hypothetical protein
LLDFVGDPVFALLMAVLLAMVTFGTAVGFTPAVLGKKIGASLMPVVGVMLIVGAGGGFKQSLVDGGTGYGHRQDRAGGGPVHAAARLDRGRADPPGHRLGHRRHGDGRGHRRAAGQRAWRRRSCRWWCWPWAPARCSSRT